MMAPEVQELSVFDQRYEIIDVVGRGRNSIVYRARRAPVSRDETSKSIPVALKILIGNPKNPEFNMQRMKREALAMLACRHENVIKLYDYVANGELYYLAMEFASLRDLEALLAEHGRPIAMPLAFKLIAQTLSGLERIHQSGIVHRDIKPSNLLLTENHVLKIADFGIAYLPTEQMSIEEAARGAGTLEYLAPECLQEGACYPASDLYSVGITLYQLLTNRHPFEGTSFSEIINSKVAGGMTPIAELIQNPPPHLQELLNIALAAKPEERFQSAGEFRSAIEAFAQGQWQAPEEAVIPSNTIRLTEALEEVDEPSDELADDFSFEGFEDLDESDEVAELDESDEIEELDESEESEEESTEEAAEAPSFSPTRLTELSPDDIRRREEQLQSMEVEEPPQSDGFSYLQQLSNYRRIIAVAVVFAVVVFAIWKWQLPDAPQEIATPANETSDFLVEESEEGLFEQTEAQQGAQEVLSPVAQVLARGEHRGILRGLFADDVDISLVTSADELSGEMVIALGIPGWQASTESLADIDVGKELRLVGSGLQLSLWIAQEENTDGRISGRYQEHLSGRKGSWSIQ